MVKQCVREELENLALKITSELQGFPVQPKA